jgi:hypothetical protein
MDDANPYLPPHAPIADSGRAGAGAGLDDAAPALPPWRLEGRTLFARHGTTLPDICLFTGEPTKPSQRLRVPLSWTPIWFKVFVVCAPMLAAMSYSALRRPSNVQFGLGPAGEKRRRLCLLLCLAGMINGIALMLAVSELALFGFLLLTLLTLIFALLPLRIFRVVKIDRRYARLRLRHRVADAFARLPAPPPAA